MDVGTQRGMTEWPARCSGGRRPLIAGCLSLQRLGVDLPVTRQVCDLNLWPPGSESRSSSQLSFRCSYQSICSMCSQHTTLDIGPDSGISTKSGTRICILCIIYRFLRLDGDKTGRIRSHTNNNANGINHHCSPDLLHPRADPKLSGPEMGELKWVSWNG